MDLHAHQGDTVTHVATIHRDTPDDGPVHLISLVRLERYWAIEALLRETVALLREAVALLDPPGGQPE